MAWYQGILCILLGNTIVLFPIVLNGHAGVGLGASIPNRLQLGQTCSQVPTVVSRNA